MSYDVSLLIDTGSDELHEIWTGNFTSNCARMFDLAIGGLGILDGMMADDAWHILVVGVKRMEVCRETNIHSARYLALNPGNMNFEHDNLYPTFIWQIIENLVDAWGDSISAQDFLRSILEQCEKHPDARIKVIS